MGTDISCYVEKKVEGGWSLGEPLEPNPYWSEAFPEEEPKMVPQPLFTTRNYALFSIMANVCNPMRALEPFDFVSQPRGFPDEASSELRAYYHFERENVHSASWLLVTEMLDFNWGRTIRRRGVVEPRVAHLFPPDRVGFPIEGWPQGVPISVADAGTGTEVRWTETYRQAAGPELFETILPKLATYGPADAVRIVFWFNP